MSYIVFDDESQPIRIVGRKEEATAICAIRKGWWFKFMKAKKAEDYQFEEALF